MPIRTSSGIPIAARCRNLALNTGRLPPMTLCGCGQRPRCQLGVGAMVADLAFRLPARCCEQHVPPQSRQTGCHEPKRSVTAILMRTCTLQTAFATNATNLTFTSLRRPMAMICQNKPNGQNLVVTIQQGCERCHSNQHLTHHCRSRIPMRSGEVATN